MKNLANYMGRKGLPMPQGPQPGGPPGGDGMPPMGIQPPQQPPMQPQTPPSPPMQQNMMGRMPTRGISQSTPMLDRYMAHQDKPLPQLTLAANEGSGSGSGEWNPFYQEPKAPPLKKQGSVEKNDHTILGPSYGDATPDGGYWGDDKHPLPRG